MNVAGRTIGQMILIAAVATGVGFGVNTVRGKERIDLHRQYKPVIPPERLQPPVKEVESDGNTPAVEYINGFRVAPLAEVKEIFEHPGYEYQQFVIIDARSDDPYTQGHIPGALQCDFWRLKDYIEHVAPPALSAERVIVYCNGGACEDSLQLCAELVNYGVAQEKLAVYKGGWEEWLKAGLPAETGRPGGAP